MTETTADRTYADFLHLPDLLAAVTPQTAQDNPRIYTAEHFFLVAHQTSELWLKQALIDISAAVTALAAPNRDLDEATMHVDRASEVVRLLAAHTAAFRHLQPADFAQFRAAFGSASGAQSAQFHRLTAELGLYGHDSPLLRELLATVAELGTSLEWVYQEAPYNHPLHRLVLVMTDLSQAVWQWQLNHLETVSRVIGSAPGTGGTSGGGFLAERLSAPFTVLWSARARVHRDRP
jgi:tryptophan 2,3-dioxygenase